MVAPYIPDRGDVVWLNFSPTAGSEQHAHRPALVISGKLYNERSRLIVVCAMTSRRKERAFEVPVKFERRSGSVLVDQVRSVDRIARSASFAGKIGPSELAVVLGQLQALLFR